MPGLVFLAQPWPLPAQSCATPGQHWTLHCPCQGTQTLWCPRARPAPSQEQIWPLVPSTGPGVPQGAGTAAAPDPAPIPATLSSYPSLDYPRYCSNSPLQVKGTCSAHSHRPRPCGFGSRSADKPGEGRGMLRPGHGTSSESPSAPRNSLFCTELMILGLQTERDEGAGEVGAARASPCPEPLPALLGITVFKATRVARGETSWEREGAQHPLPLPQETAHFSIILGLHRSNIQACKREYKCSVPPQTWLCSPGFTQHRQRAGFTL